MKKETLDFIKKHHMLSPGDRVVAGVSGGADSVCLLHLLWCLKKELGIELKAIHVHHGLRGEEADRDADFTAAFCRQLGIPCEVVRIRADLEAEKQGISVEEAGRNARYRIMEEAAAVWEQERTGKGKTSAGSAQEAYTVKIAVAHHGDDSAETILHNLFRGSGLKGLSGIAPVRGRIIRPLLCVGREDILAYLEEEGLDFVTDSTNGEDDYTRNRIRNRILPLITSEINEKAVANILRAGELMESADRYFEKRAGEWLLEHGRAGRTTLPADAFSEEETVLQGYIIRDILKGMGCPLKDVTARHAEEILSLLKKQSGRKADLPYGISVRREYGELKFTKKNELQEGETPELPQLNMRKFPREKQHNFPKNQYTKWFDYDRIKVALSVRYRQTGDYITLPGGGRKSVKSFMIDEKIPAGKRGGIALLAEGSHILWIIGYRISEYYKVTEETKNILEVRLDGGTDGGR